jgi:hypothetical protein
MNKLPNSNTAPKQQLNGKAVGREALDAVFSNGQSPDGDSFKSVFASSLNRIDDGISAAGKGQIQISDNGTDKLTLSNGKIAADISLDISSKGDITLNPAEGKSVTINGDANFDIQALSLMGKAFPFELTEQDVEVNGTNEKEHYYKGSFTANTDGYVIATPESDLKKVAELEIEYFSYCMIKSEDLCVKSTNASTICGFSSQSLSMPVRMGKTFTAEHIFLFDQGVGVNSDDPIPIKYWFVPLGNTNDGPITKIDETVTDSHIDLPLGQMKNLYEQNIKTSLDLGKDIVSLLEEVTDKHIKKDKRAKLVNALSRLRLVI